MESFLNESEKSRMRELLIRLDRVATMSRGHRAGLHLYDLALFDQYMSILDTWKHEVLASTARSTQPPLEQVADQSRPRPAARS